VTAIPLRRRLPGAFSNLPGRPDPDMDPEDLLPLSQRRAPRRPYSVLLPVGFAVPPALPQARCALTAPFHPYRSLPAGGERWARRSVLCGTVPGLTPAGRYPAPYVHGARTFLSGHLSALARAAVQPTDAVRDGVCAGERQGLRHDRVSAGEAGSRWPQPGLPALSRASRAARRSFSVETVETSMTPSTCCGRKWRWKAATASRVALSR
jgi:hypothetical protein